MTSSDAEHQANTAPEVREASPNVRARSRQTWWSIGLVFLTAMTCVLCALAAIPTVFTVGTAFSLYAYFFEQPKVQQVLNDYMVAQSQGDFDKAVSLWSTRSFEHTTRIAIETMFYSDYGFLLEGYKNVALDYVEFSSNNVDTAEAPAGQVVMVDGRVQLESGWEGGMHAVLEQENGNWRIYDISVDIPPGIGYP